MRSVLNTPPTLTTSSKRRPVPSRNSSGMPTFDNYNYRFVFLNSWFMYIRTFASSKDAAMDLNVTGLQVIKKIKEYGKQ
jgi:hypothetical protein